MPYRIRKSIDLDFAHSIYGHMGHCLNLHGHTWKFEVVIEAELLDDSGMVIDFKDLKNRILKPVHDLLDHSLAVSRITYGQIERNLKGVGSLLLATRKGEGERVPETFMVYGGEAVNCGGIKVTTFPFNPTSERLAEWLYRWTNHEFQTNGPFNAVLKEVGTFPRVKCVEALVYETLHPVQAIASYTG